MNSHFRAIAVVLAAGVVSTMPARAEDPHAFAVSIGYFDVVKGDDSAAEFRAEYRSDFKWLFFKPFVGGTITTDSAGLIYAGVYSDFHLGRRIVVSPSIAPAYFSQGNGRDLGNDIEFRSQLEIAYRFDNKARLGISFNHISNAGLGDSNKGSESLAVTYSIPIR